MNENPKQLGQRYRVRQDPYFHGFWCIVDRELLWYLYDKCSHRMLMRFSRVSITGGEYGPEIYHTREADDALQMVKLLEISDKVNRGE